MAASNAKSKRKCKGKTLNLTTFLGEDQDAPTGFAVVNTRRIDWGDAMENEDLDDRYTLDFKKDEKLVLPTAPKAARGPDVDLGKVPTKPPYTAFLGNLPYDVSEDDIANFFRQLQVTNVRLPRENGDKGRIRGFGYAEFHDRDNLIQALALNNETLKNRAIKVSLAGEHDGERDRRDGGSDRTMGDWRADKRDQFSRDDFSRNDNYSSSRGGYSDRDSYRGGSGFENFSRDRYDRNERNGDRYERNDYNYRNDRDFGRDQDRFDRRPSGDRGYGFSDRGTSRGGGRRDNYGRREDAPRDFRTSEPPGERRPPERPSYDSEGPKERRKLQLAPRTKPIEPVEAVSSSSIFGGAKPVDTAAREREIEARLAREKDPKERHSSREEDDPRQPDREQHSMLPKTRQRCSSNSSTGSETSRGHPKKETYNNYARSENSDEGGPRCNNSDSSYSEAKGGFRTARHSQQDTPRDKVTHAVMLEEPKPPVYASVNKFSHLANESEDVDRGSNSD